jgi:hypothetical protein
MVSALLRGCFMTTTCRKCTQSIEDFYRLQFLRRTHRLARIWKRRLRSRTAGLPVDVRAGRFETSEIKRVTACGGMLRKSFGHGPTSTVPRHAALSDLAFKLENRGRPAQFFPGRSDKRGCEGRLRSPAKGEIPFTFRCRMRSLNVMPELETTRSNVIRQASGSRAQTAFSYTSHPARAS